MQKLVDSDLVGTPAKDFTQFVRGQLFVAAEYLLTSWQAKKDPADTDAELIVEFCTVLIKVICKWLTISPKYFSLVLSLGLI